MRLAWQSAALMPVLILLPIVVTQAQTCSNGIAGYEASGACCPRSCGSCGGSGCSKRGKGCCTSTIKASGVKCTSSKSAPCIIDGDGSNSVNGKADTRTCPGGIPGISGNDVVCCPLSCGSCGGSGCSGKPGGRNSCCGNGIKETQGFCGDTKKAPCNLVKGSSNTVASDSGFSGGQYGENFTGKATYYGKTTGGHCSFADKPPRQYNGMIPMALNTPQYGDSLMCGACVEGTASGKGSGKNPIPSKFKGYITDECPECPHGDLDFATSGDGRWDIKWKFVECPGEDISFISPSANGWYWKLQPRGTKTPVQSLEMEGQTARRTSDNHFVLSQSGKAWSGTQDITTTTIAGNRSTTRLRLY